MAILILGGGDDEHALYMLNYLRSGGTEAELLDSRWFPQRMTIDYSPADGRGTFRLPGGQRLPLDEISAVYWRGYPGVAAPQLPDPEQDFIAQNDSRSLLESILIRLPARWVNSWHAFQLHQTKPVQLAIVASLGMPIPQTVVTNEPESVVGFAQAIPAAIFKPVQGGAHTRRLTAGHLTAEHLEHLRIAPVTVQEEVRGTNIRVFVAGERVLACELATEAIDFREDPEARITPHALPADLEAASRRIARALDLQWTGIDFRLTPDGQYVFLEANPSPMFLGFERAAGLPLTEHLATLLTA